MLTYKDAHCPIVACPCNRNGRGCFCDYLIHGWSCDHPTYRRRWRAAMGYEDPGADVGAVEAGRAVKVLRERSLTARVDAARRSSTPMDRDRARQLVLEMEVNG